MKSAMSRYDMGRAEQDRRRYSQQPRWFDPPVRRLQPRLGDLRKGRLDAPVEGEPCLGRKGFPGGPPHQLDADALFERCQSDG